MIRADEASGKSEEPLSDVTTILLDSRSKTVCRAETSLGRTMVIIHRAKQIAVHTSFAFTALGRVD